MVHNSLWLFLPGGGPKVFLDSRWDLGVAINIPQDIYKVLELPRGKVVFHNNLVKVFAKILVLIGLFNFLDLVNLPLLESIEIVIAHLSLEVLARIVADDLDQASDV